MLLNHGYTSPFTEDFFVKHQLRTSADCPLQSKGDPIPYLLEVHWTILQHAARDLEAVKNLWDEARPKAFFGVPAYAPSAEWEFLSLAWHAASHKWQTLKWLADIHDLCTTRLLDWRNVKEKAERFDLTQAVEITLTVTAHLFGTAMPHGFAARPLAPDFKLFPASLSTFESEQQVVAAAQPGMARPHLLLGQCYTALNDLQTAKTELLTAARADPADPQPHYLLAKVYRELRDPESTKPRDYGIPPRRGGDRSGIHAGR